MGPNILLDKSALQSLSLTNGEIYKLSHHFNFVTCSVLLTEILGDLKKGQTGAEYSTDEVRQLAQKLLGGGYHCADYRRLIAGDLMGYGIPMTGQVPLEGGKTTTNAAGQKGVVFGPSPENRAINRWRVGDFSEAEKELAEFWREATRALDLEKFRRENLARMKVHRFKNLDNLHRYINFITQPTDTGERRRLLRAMMDEFDILPAAQALVLAKWDSAGNPAIDTYCPYAYYCFKVTQVFSDGVITGLITTRPSNRIDMQYFYYVPFCMVFSSRDNLHRDLASTFLRHDQSFVHGDELKADLKSLVEKSNALTSEERREREFQYGSYPPFDDNSVIHRLWRKHMRPWAPGSGNRAVKMSKEEEQALLKLINSLTERSEEPE
jgi:hypothetical protein